MNRRRALALWLVTGLGGAALLAALAVAAPLLPRLPAPPCLFKHATGLACPLCGLTRAVAWLLRGEWATAVGLHPLAPLLAGEAALAYGAWGAWAAGWASFPLASSLRRLAWVNLAALAALWLGRLTAGSLPP